MSKWPVTLQGFLVGAKPGIVRQYYKAGELQACRFNCLAGNVAVIHTVAEDGDPGAVLLHSSEKQFAPTVCSDDGTLSVTSAPRWTSFMGQTKRINTLLIVGSRSGVKNISVAMKFGEVHYFGPVGLNGNKEAVRSSGLLLDSLRLGTWAGDCVAIDPTAAQIEATNKFGDVRVTFDMLGNILGKEQTQVNLASPDKPPIVEGIKASTMFGDANVDCYTAAGGEEVVLPYFGEDALPYVATHTIDGRVPNEGGANRGIRITKHRTGLRMREKWMGGMGRDFLIHEI